MEVFPQLVAVDLNSTKGSSGVVGEKSSITVSSSWQEEWRAKEKVSVMRLLASELRAAKEGALACAEVLLPSQLLPAIADRIIECADTEPYGLRGCTLFIDLETDDDSRRHVTQFKYDAETVSTFELYLTLRQDHISWHSLLPQFLRNFTRGGTLVLSENFNLEKTKLYRSYLQHYD